MHTQRISMETIRNDDWFKRNYVPAGFLEYEDVNLDNLNAVFDDPEVVRFSTAIFIQFSLLT